MTRKMLYFRISKNKFEGNNNYKLDFDENWCI